MNRVALEHGFDVVATGHNMDDEAATLLGNLINWQMDALSRQSPVLESSHPRLVKRVKPLYLLSERDTASYALLRGIDYIFEECPHAEGALSITYKEALNDIEARSPGAKHRFLTGFLKRMAPLLGAQEAVELRECAVCGYVTTGDVCSFCRTWDRARERARRRREAEVREAGATTAAAAGPNPGVLVDGASSEDGAGA